MSKALDLELARGREELAGNYAQASAAADAGDWEQAVAKYSMVAAAAQPRSTVPPRCSHDAASVLSRVVTRGPD